MKITVKDIDIKDKKVIIRCDFNVPLDEEKKITDTKRIVSALPTIKYALSQNAKVILMSHLGRPKGEYNPKYSLEPVAKELEKELNQKIIFAKSETVVDDNVRDIAKELASGDIMLLENLRFRKEEEANDEGFAKELASLADVYINDAFGTAHRAHASTEGIAKFLPSAIGFLMEKEVEFLGDTLENPKRPFIAILGGAKVSDKIRVIESLLEKVNTLIIGGGMAYTFFKAEGLEIGKSLLDETAIDLAKEIIQKAKDKGVEMILPIDIVAADKFDNEANTKIVNANEMPADMEGLDIGQFSIEKFSEKIMAAGTVLWNGPMGVFEMPNFAKGTLGVCEAMAKSDAITIIGGGDSAAAASQLGFADKMTHISTGGGASLEFIENGTLPGLEVIKDK